MSYSNKLYFIKKVETVDKYKNAKYFVLTKKEYKNGNISNSVKLFMNFESAKRYKLLMLMNKKVISCDIIFNDITY